MENELPINNDSDNEEVELFPGEDTCASDLVYDNMKQYTRETIKTMFPRAIDGLGDVGRRIIFGTLPNRNVLSKFNNLIASVMNLHIHGDLSIREAMDNQSQPWRTHIPLLKYEGQAGSYSGDAAAANRYLEGRLSDIAYDIYFKYTNMSVIKTRVSESGVGTEPVHLVPVIPAALISNYQLISPAFRFRTLPISINSACEIVADFIEFKKQNPFWDRRRSIPQSIIQHLIPDTPIIGLVRNTKQIYEQYSQNNFNLPFIVDGVLEVTKNTINVKTIPNGEVLNRQWELEKVLMPDQNSWFNKSFSGFQPNDDVVWADHTFVVKRGVEPFTVLDRIKRFYRFTQSLKRFPNWINEFGEKQEMTPIQLLAVWYKERYTAVCNQLRIEQNNLIFRIRKFQVLILAIDNSDEIQTVFKAAEHPDLAAIEIIKRFPSLTKMQAKFIFDLSYKELTVSGKADIEKKIAEAKVRIEEINNDLLNIDRVILRDVNIIKKTYGSSKEPYFYKDCLIDSSVRANKIPMFKYICKVRDIGYIQCFTIQEVEDVVRTHDYNNVQIQIYPEGDFEKIMVNLENKVVTEDQLDFPQVFAAYLFLVTKIKLTNTIILDRDTGKVLRVDRLMFNKEKSTNRDIYFVGETFTSILNDGTIDQMNVAEIPLRKQFDGSGNLTNIKHISHVTSDKLFVVYINKSLPNTIIFDRPTNKKVSMDEASILYVGDENEIVVSMIDPVYNKLATKHLKFSGVHNLFAQNNRTSFTLSTSKFSISSVNSQTKTINRWMKEITIS